MESSGAKTVAVDLSAIRDGLAPFREQPLKGFADFLVRAEGYYSRGEVPIKPPPGGKTGGSKEPKPGPSKPSPPDVNALGLEVEQIYSSAADPRVDREKIVATVNRLAPLTKDGLVIIADRIGLLGMRAKNKPIILDAIRDHILARKGATQKASQVDRGEQIGSNGATAPTIGAPR